MKEKVVISLSGGMDSVTLLYYLKSKGYDVYAYSFFMKSKHNPKELPLAQKNCELLGVPHKIIDISFINDIFKSDLLQSGGDIPEGSYDNENQKATVIPFRNGIMLSILTGVAESIGCKYIALGNHAGDHAIYPDCREEFSSYFAGAAKSGTYMGVEFLRPFVKLTKSQVCEIGLKLGINYSLTWSCYKGLGEPCGRCGTCYERVESFLDNNTKDPSMTDDRWEESVKFYNQEKSRSK